MRNPPGVPVRLEARFAGLLYLLSILLGVAALMASSRHMQARGDKLNFIAAILYSGLTILLWHLLWPVNKWVSTLAAAFSFAGSWLPPSVFTTLHIGNFVFFGLYCLLIGYLIVRSQFFPNTVGILMACAGVCWLITAWPLLAHALSPYPVIVGLIGEGALMGYLLVKGLNETRWREQAKLAP